MAGGWAFAKALCLSNAGDLRGGVDPDDFAASFGEGVSLKRITVQITDDPVTTGIEERLGWLGDLKQYRTDPDNPITNTLPPEIGKSEEQIE